MTQNIFVLNTYQRQGIGQYLFEFCIKEAKKRGCGRMEWCVFDWNAPALAFYKKNNATKLQKTYYRLTKEQLNEKTL